MTLSRKPPASAHPDAFEIVGDPGVGGAFVFTCEHATHRVSPPLCASASDWLWLQQHWGWDPGIEDVTRSLLEATSSCGIFSRFSRLICDPNRDVEAPSWLPTHIEGEALALNADLDDTEKERRRRQYHEPYHNALSGLVAQRLGVADAPMTLMAMHSFTPVYKKEIRALEIGVLYDENWASAASVLADCLAEEGFLVEHNAPYSGMDGMIYSAWRHGNEHQVRYMELEIRQDLISTKERAVAVAERILPGLERFVALCHPVV